MSSLRTPGGTLPCQRSDSRTSVPQNFKRKKKVLFKQPSWWSSATATGNEHRWVAGALCQVSERSASISGGRPPPVYASDPTCCISVSAGASLGEGTSRATLNRTQARNSETCGHWGGKGSHPCRKPGCCYFVACQDMLRMAGVPGTKCHKHFS